MIKGREGIALGILIVAAFLGCLTVVQIASQPSGSQNQSQYAEGTAADQELAEHRAGIKHKRPATDRSVCREAKTEKEYELCQAWRAASAAQEAADAAWQQIYLSIGGLVGLLLTVFLTGIAAKAASTSAEAAQKTLIVSERPWLEVEATLASGLTWYTGNDMRFLVSLKMWNHGRSPAVSIQIYRDLCLLGEDTSQKLRDLVTDARAGKLQPLLQKPIFPASRDRASLSLHIRAADVQAVIPRIQPNMRIDPAVIGCVLYKSAFSDEVHHVGFMYELRIADDFQRNVWGPFAIRADGTLECGPVETGILSFNNVPLRNPLG